MTAAVAFTEPCPQCGGTGGEMHQHIVAVAGHAPGCEGSTCERTCPVEVPMPVDEWEPCNYCHSGMVPDDATVEAHAVAMSRIPSGPGLALPADVWLELSRAGLVAAARYQSEVSDG